MTMTKKADAIINALKAQAASILSAALGSAKLEAFHVGSKGNMPYYWEDPRNLQFNARTYNWISAGLDTGKAPVQLAGSFLSLYIDALSKVSYSLSTDDIAQLNRAKANATDQQGAVLRAWREAFGSLPSGEGQPIDLIAGKVASEWANPATTLTEIQRSINLDELLNNVPAAGKPVVPVFASWLNALGVAVSLQNNTTMNNGYLRRALQAAQTATAENGGLTLNDNSIVPRYEVATALDQIINGLENSGQAATMEMTVTRSTKDEFRVEVKGGATFSIPVFELFTLNVGGNARYFQSDLATTDNKVTVKMSFPGVTLVNFGPKDFTMTPSRNWFWMKPITDAIENRGKDVSGFKFAPEPQIDFSESGPFGFLQGAVISNYPTMEITVESSSYRRIQKTFEQSVKVGVSFLGIPLGINVEESTYSNKVTTDASNSKVTIKLEPPKELVAGANTDSVGWILGVVPRYPAV